MRGSIDQVLSIISDFSLVNKLWVQEKLSLSEEWEKQEQLIGDLNFKSRSYRSCPSLFSCPTMKPKWVNTERDSEALRTSNHTNLAAGKITLKDESFPLCFTSDKITYFHPLHSDLL